MEKHQNSINAAPSCIARRDILYIETVFCGYVQSSTIAYRRRDETYLATSETGRAREDIRSRHTLYYHRVQHCSSCTCYTLVMFFKNPMVIRENESDRTERTLWIREERSACQRRIKDAIVIRFRGRIKCAAAPRIIRFNRRFPHSRDDLIFFTQKYLYVYLYIYTGCLTGEDGRSQFLFLYTYGSRTAAIF